MQSKRTIEILVGFMMIVAIGSMLMLALRVSGLKSHATSDSHYAVVARFDNIGGLKVRAPVRIAGVLIGRVRKITLDPHSFQAKVRININSASSHIPEDSTASILTEGLLGANYISITPGFEEAYLKEGDEIEETHSAVVLEDLLGQFLYHSNTQPSASKQNVEPKPVKEKPLIIQPSS